MPSVDYTESIAKVFEFKKHGGLRIEKLLATGSLLDVDLIRNLFSKEPEGIVKATALYGAIYVLVREGTRKPAEPDNEEIRHDTITNYRRECLALAYAFNLAVDSDLPWSDTERLWNPDWGTLRTRFASARTQVAWHLDVDDRHLVTLSQRAWNEIARRIINWEGEPPEELKAWAESIRTDSHRIFFHVPHVAEPFVGREAVGANPVAEIMQLLAQGSVVAITGSPGIGKSQVAARVARRLYDEQDEKAPFHAIHVAFLDCSSSAYIDQFAELGVRLGATSEDRSLMQQIEATQRYLASTPERWLLVLDDIRDAQTYLDLIPTRPANGSVLLTTWVRGLLPGGAVPVRLGTISESAAVELLLRAAGRDEDENASSLAYELDYFPLALAQAGAYCQDGASFGRYLELLRTERLAELSDNPDLTPYYRQINTSERNTLLRTFELAYFAAGVQCALAPALFGTIAFLDGSHIEERLLNKTYCSDVVFTGYGSSRLFDHDFLEAALRALARYHLIDRYDSYLTVHSIRQRLGREVARNTFTSPHLQQLLQESVGLERYIVEYPLVAFATIGWDSSKWDPTDGGSWVSFAQRMPHLLRLCDELSFDGSCGLIKFPDVGDLCIRFLQYAVGAGRSDGPEVCARVLSFFRRAGHADDYFGGAALLFHGIATTHDLSTEEPLAEIEQALAILERELAASPITFCTYLTEAASRF